MLAQTNNINRVIGFAAIVMILTTVGLARVGRAEVVNDYFNLLTSQHLPILDKFKNRGDLIETADTRNNYLFFAHEEWKGWGELVVFEKKGGKNLIAVTQYDCRQTRPSVPRDLWRECSGNIHFLEPTGNELVEAPQFAPQLRELQLYRQYEKKTGRFARSEEKLIFELPRERKDILIKLAGEPVYSMIWNGEKFEGSYIN